MDDFVSAKDVLTDEKATTGIRSRKTSPFVERLLRLRIEGAILSFAMLVVCLVLWWWVATHP